MCNTTKASNGGQSSYWYSVRAGISPSSIESVAINRHQLSIFVLASLTIASATLNVVLRCAHMLFGLASFSPRRAANSDDSPVHSEHSSHLPSFLPFHRLTRIHIKLLDVLMRRDLIASRELFPFSRHPLPRPSRRASRRDIWSRNMIMRGFSLGKGRDTNG